MSRHSEMVERVAERLWQRESLRAGGRPRLEPWADVAGDHREKWLDLARAAIEAMREPTDMMLERGVFTHGLSSRLGVDKHWARCAWHSMVDEALNKPDENAIFRSLFEKRMAEKQSAALQEEGKME